MSSKLKAFLQVVFFGLLLLFATLYLADQWDAFRTNSPQAAWGVLLVSQIILTIGLGLLPLGAWLLLRFISKPLPMIVVWRIFFVSNMAKYLPGSVWALPGRAFLYQRAGLSTKTGILAVVWEVGLMVGSAALVSLLSLRIIVERVPSSWIIAIAGLMTLLLLALFLIVNQPNLRTQVLNSVMRLPLMGRVQQTIGGEGLGLTTAQIASIIAAYALGWAVIGLGFALMVFGLVPTFEPLWALEFMGLYTGSWIIGFLVIFAPGGIGVRDVLIIVGLSLFYSEPLPAIIAIAARIAWTLAEITGVIVTSLLYRTQKQTTDFITSTSPRDQSSTKY